jgi:hypothetical protein
MKNTSPRWIKICRGHYKDSQSDLEIFNGGIFKPEWRLCRDEVVLATFPTYEDAQIGAYKELAEPPFNAAEIARRCGF